MKRATTLTFASALALVTSVCAYTLTSDSVACYEWPDNSTAIEHEYTTKQDVKVVCLEPGTVDKASWALTEDTDCYIPAAYLDIGGSVEACSDDFPEDTDGDEELGDDYQLSNEDLDNSADSGLAVRADNYPYKGNCGGVDAWNFYRCECVSFAAWRIRKVIGIKFNNNWKGVHWGYAKNWNNAAKEAGVKITKKPKKKTVGQTDAGSSGGHVVWITKVSKNKKYVNLEEYNYAKRHTYGKRTKVAASTYRYLHFTK